MRQRDSVIVIDTVIDDMSPMALGYLLESVTEAGARDTYIVPCIMKKSRPGHLVTVITDGRHFKKIVDTIFRESTTTGVRYRRTERVTLGRASKKVSTKYGTVSVKVNSGNKCMPEFESCKQAAKKKKIPFLKVYEEAKRRCDDKGFKP